MYGSFVLGYYDPVIGANIANDINKALLSMNSSPVNIRIAPTGEQLIGSVCRDCSALFSYNGLGKGMSGVDAIKKAKQTRPELPAYLLHNGFDSRLFREAQKAGAIYIDTSSPTALKQMANIVKWHLIDR
ncbi:MAG: hypothetical protein NT129_01825 [Candidatus Aenigmarchaeota archaeon]|nr:hypothetical protein [Candidatus Aenigmarchaeota archaeon]